MNNRMYSAIALLALGTGLFALEVKEPEMHLKIMTMTKAEPPRVFGDSLLFTFDGPARSVGIVFDYEDFATIHPLLKRAAPAPGQTRDPGLFFYALAIPFETKEIGYRFVVDGLWTADPANKARRVDPRSGLSISVAVVPYFSRVAPGLYEVVDGEGYARFIFMGSGGVEVCVAGDFNGWDPFMHQLVEVAPGRYELRLKLSPGEHKYYFVVSGSHLPDPLNPRRVYSPSGEAVSVVLVP